MKRKIIQSLIYAAPSFEGKILRKWTNKKDKIVKIENNCITHIGADMKTDNFKKALIVTDKMLMELGLLKPMINSLEANGREYVIFDEVQPNPFVSTCETGCEVALKENCDLIIGFGGGSSLDASKVIAGLAKNEKYRGNHDKYTTVFNLGAFSLKGKGALPLYAIPSTSGTGSEATIGAVVTDDNTHQKFTAADPCLVPGRVYIDSSVTMGLPRFLSADTGMDALSHALEGVCSKTVRKHKWAYATQMESIKLIFDYLPRVCENGLDLEARENVGKAAYLAGDGMNIGFVGGVHSIGHAVGALANIPHGRAMGLILPHVMELHKEVCPEVFADIAINIGVATSADTQLDAMNKFFDALNNLYTEIDYPVNDDKIKAKMYAEVYARSDEELMTYPVSKFLSRDETYSVLSEITAH